jgi:hypothetical protein
MQHCVLWLCVAWRDPALCVLCVSQAVLHVFVRLWHTLASRSVYCIWQVNHTHPACRIPSLHVLTPCLFVCLLCKRGSNLNFDTQHTRHVSPFEE